MVERARVLASEKSFESDLWTDEDGVPPLLL